jgi:hypothetical protein
MEIARVAFDKKKGFLYFFLSKDKLARTSANKGEGT